MPTDDQFQEIWNLHPEDKGKISIYGKEIDTPRWFQNYMHDYAFSRSNHASIPLPDILQPYLDYINELCETEYNVAHVNGLLVNWYQDGSHYIGAHSDSEKDLVPGHPIFCISLGQERIFRIRDKATKKIVVDIPTTHGAIIVMSYEMQAMYTHEITKQSSNKVKEPRVSLTFRRFRK
jgi:alkylated DNA repair dioxygenase AlkB